jgi:hypothetical protein
MVDGDREKKSLLVMGTRVLCWAYGFVIISC